MILILERLSYLYYPIASCSIYINRRAMLIPGNTIPTIGTKIDGKYAAVI